MPANFTHKGVFYTHMKNFALSLFLTLGLILNLILPHAVSHASEFPPVLMYHDIKTVPVNGFDVSTKNFAAQLDLLKSEGYTTLGADDFAECLMSGDFPAKSVVITFDDGYRGVYMNALPELRKRNMKAVLFIITEMVGRLDTGYPHITHQELKEMASDDLISFGSHSLTHPNFLQLSREERRSQLTQSRKNLEALTGRKIHAFAYPNGHYDAQIAADVQASGYDYAFVMEDRGIPDVPEQFRIPRIYMRNSMTTEKLAGFLENITPDAFTDEYGNLPVSYDVVVAGGGACS